MAKAQKARVSLDNRRRLADADYRALEHWSRFVQTQGDFEFAKSSYGKAPSDYKLKMVKRRLEAIRTEIDSVRSEEETESITSLKAFMSKIVIPYVEFWEKALASGTDLNPNDEPPWKAGYDITGSTVRFVPRTSHLS